MMQQHLTPLAAPDLGPWAWLLRGVLPAVGTALLVVHTGVRRAERLGRALDEERWEWQRRGRQRRGRRRGSSSGTGPVAAGAGAGADVKAPPPPSSSPPRSKLSPLPESPTSPIPTMIGGLSRRGLVAAALCLGGLTVLLLLALRFLLFGPDDDGEKGGGPLLLPLLTFMCVAGASLASTYLMLEEVVIRLLDTFVRASHAALGFLVRHGNKQQEQPAPQQQKSPSPPSLPSHIPLASLLACLLSAGLLVAWALTGGHWALSNAIVASVATAMVSVLRLPNLRVATLSSLALLGYDAVWALCARLALGPEFWGGVHVEVGGTTTSPMGCSGLDLGGWPWPLAWGGGASNKAVGSGVVGGAAGVPLELPLRLLFPFAPPPPTTIPIATPPTAAAVASSHTHPYNPSYQRSLAGSWCTSLGLADVVLPGLLLALSLRLDGHVVRRRRQKRQQPHQRPAAAGGEQERLSSSVGGVDREEEEGASSSSSSSSSSFSYFGVGMFGYAIGLVLALASGRALAITQPAFLVALPCLLGPVLAKAWRNGHLTLLWAGGFDSSSTTIMTPAPLATETGVDGRTTRCSSSDNVSMGMAAAAAAVGVGDGGKAAAALAVSKAAGAGLFPSSTDLLLLIV